MAIDIVRVIGNNAVHPGEIDLKDDIDTTIALFSLINKMVDVMITQPKEIDEMHGNLPEGARKAIEKRDSKLKKEKEIEIRKLLILELMAVLGKLERLSFNKFFFFLSSRLKDEHEYNCICSCSNCSTCPTSRTCLDAQPNADNKCNKAQ